MSYSEPQGRLLIFSGNKKIMENYIEDANTELDKSGCDYDGPISLSKISQRDLVRFLRHIKNPESKQTANAENLPDWLFNVAKSETDIDALTKIAESENVVFGRIIRIYGNKTIRRIFSIDVPAEVSVIGEIGDKEHQKGTGHDPYTYDPNLDHVTDS